MVKVSNGPIPHPRSHIACFSKALQNHYNRRDQGSNQTAASSHQEAGLLISM